MDLIIRDPVTGHEERAAIGVEEYSIDDDENYMAIFALMDDIDRAVSRQFIHRLKSMNKMFKPGDRVMAYTHKGEKYGKGTVVPSKDKRLLDYIRVEMDRGGAVYFRADFCKRLVPKKKPEQESYS